MVHRVIVEDQSLRWYGRPPKIADNSIEFVQLQFHLPEEWASLLLVAQFTQSETYNMLMTDDRCSLPVELKAGLCKVSLFGYSEGKPVRATSIPLVFQIEESGFVSSGETPIPPTPDLYAQLIEYFSSIAGSGGGGSGSGTINPEDIAAAVEDYLSKNPPEVPDLSDEVERAETAAQRAESANSSAQTALSGAAGAASNAGNYAKQAQGFSGSASGSAGYANARANDAEAAADRAEEAASDAEAAADRAEEAASDAEAAADRAEEAASDADAAAAKAEEAAKVTTDLDTTLTQEGKAADAKAVGDAISKLSLEKVDRYEFDNIEESVVQQVIAALGTPLFGRIENGNEIVLSGDLSDGSYVFFIEDKDGNRSLLCVHEVGGVPVVTLVWTDSLKLDKTTGEESTDTKYFACDYVEIVGGYTYTVGRGQATSQFKVEVMYYDANKSVISSAIETAWNNEVGDNEAKSFVMSPPSNAAYFRLRGYDGAMNTLTDTTPLIYVDVSESES